jgi:NADH:ubiquinone oxidoreductase subunit 3 (subunit A)
MKNIFRLIVFIAAISICSNLLSCQKNEQLELFRNLETVIDDNPDSVLNVLSDIDYKNLAQDNKAYYALLYTQSQFECGVNQASDSLILVAYSYYMNRKNDDRKLRSYYYNALFKYYKGDFKEAMKDVVVAYDIALEAQAYLWIAKTSELTEYIFYDSFNYSQAEKYAKEAVNSYLRADNISRHRYALCDLASILSKENKVKQATHLYDSIMGVIKHEFPFDSSFYNHVMNSYNDVGAKTEIVLQPNTTDMYSRYEHNKRVGKYKAATDLADSILLIQNTLLERTQIESVSSVQRDFYNAKSADNKRRSIEMKYALVLIAFIAVVTLILIYRLYCYKVRAKEAELESKVSSLIILNKQAEDIRDENKLLLNELNKKISDVSSLRQQLKNKSFDEQQKSVVVELLYKDKWSTINMLCNEYFEFGDSENMRFYVVQKIEQEIKRLQTNKSLKEIEQAVDRYMNGIMSLLRKECAFLKEDDFVFVSLIYAGFSVRAVCLFTDIKYKFYYLKKSRLIKRIMNSDAQHRDIFCEKLR